MFSAGGENFSGWALRKICISGQSVTRKKGGREITSSSFWFPISQAWGHIFLPFGGCSGSPVVWHFTQGQKWKSGLPWINTVYGMGSHVDTALRIYPEKLARGNSGHSGLVQVGASPF